MMVIENADVGQEPSQQKALGTGSVTGRIMPPTTRVAHILMPRTYEYVTLYGKRNFTDVIRLRVLRGTHFTGSPRHVNVVTGILTRGQRQRKGDIGEIRGQGNEMPSEEG